MIYNSYKLFIQWFYVYLSDRFAIELNELMPSEATSLPPTDVRWRPDQRALEDGKIAEAESIKLGVEQVERILVLAAGGKAQKRKCSP